MAGSVVAGIDWASEVHVTCLVDGDGTDAALTPNAGMAAVTQLCDRLGVIGVLDAAVGPVLQRARGFGAGLLLAGQAAAQLAGEGFLTVSRSRIGLWR